MSNSDKPSTLWDLIKFILGWILGRRKAKEQEKRERFKEIHRKLKNEYEEIDKDAEKQKQKDVKDRLDHMFDN
jgi:hypothetical protein